MNKKLTIKFSKRRPGDVAKVYADTKKIKQILKWKPRYNNLNKILNSSFRWEKKLNR